MPSGEFKIVPGYTHASRRDINGRSFSEMEARIASASSPLVEITGGLSQHPWVIIEGKVRKRIQFGIKTYTGLPPTPEYVRDLDKAIPGDIPTNIPFILEFSGMILPAGTVEHRATLVTLEPNSEADQRQQRKYYVIS